jgi:hypothetical protein
MKRLLATLSVLAVLAVSVVATAPASANPITYGELSLSCVQTNAGAKYILKYQTHEFSYTVPGAKCLI